MSEQENLIVTLVDEDGEEFEAELYDSIEYDGRIYSLLIPTDDEEGDSVIIMEYKEDGDDVLLTPVENEVLMDEIWQAYLDDTEGDEE